MPPMQIAEALPNDVRTGSRSPGRQRVRFPTPPTARRSECEPPPWLIQRRRQTCKRLSLPPRETKRGRLCGGALLSHDWLKSHPRPIRGRPCEGDRRGRNRGDRHRCLAIGITSRCAGSCVPSGFLLRLRSRRRIAERLLLKADAKRVARFSGDGPRADRRFPYLASLEDSDHAQSANRL